MIFKIKIDDELGEFYQAEADQLKVEVEEVLAQRLRAAGALDPRQRWIILEGQARVRAEEILGGMPLTGPMDLVNKVARLARIKFGDHELQLSAGQLEEIKHRAFKQSISIDRAIQGIWAAFKDKFLELVP